MSQLPGSVTVRSSRPEDDAAIAGLWARCGLVMDWNPPHEDIGRLRTTNHGALLVGENDTGIVSTVMVGHDGHRGWLYYLAVDPAHRRQGLGQRMVAEAEAWLSSAGMPKSMLMVRASNREVEAFYQRLGYRLSPVNVLQRWLNERGGHDMSGKREVTVTYLEMRERPVREAVAPPALPHAILRLHEPDPKFYRFMHDTIGRRWLWYERRLIADDQLRAIIHDEDVEIYVLYLRGNPGGFVELDRRSHPVVNIRFLGLMETQIGHGLGRYLLSWAIEQAWQGETERVTVDTCSFDHPRALSLYQRAGFVPVRRETAQVDDPELIVRRLEQSGSC